jgi:hypothetical protein
MSIRFWHIACAVILAPAWVPWFVAGEVRMAYARAAQAWRRR